MRTAILLSLLLVATACNGRSPSFSGTAFAANVPSIRFSGRCLIQTASRAPLICQDFWNRPDSELEAAERTQCLVSGASWASEPCSATGRQGGCRSKTDEAGAYVIQWAYLPETVRDAREVCPRDGASVWLE